MATGIVLGVAAWLTLSALAAKSPRVVADRKLVAKDVAPAIQNSSAPDPAGTTDPAKPDEPPPPKPDETAASDAVSPKQPEPSVPAVAVDPPAASKPEAAAPAAENAAEPSAEGKPASMPAKPEPEDPKPEDPKAAPAASEAGPGEPAGRDPLADPATSDTSSSALAQIEMHLDDKFVKLDFQEKTLREFLDVIGEFSTIPIGLDREALAKVGKGPLTLVTVRKNDVTVAQALEAALARHGLEAVVRGGKLVVTTVPAKP